MISCSSANFVCGKNKYSKVYSKVSLLFIMFEYAGKLLTDVTNISFLGIQIDNHLNWKSHMNLMLPKVYAACFALG